MRAISILAAAAALLAAPQAHAKPWTLAALHNFCTSANCADGSGPTAGLARDAKGNLYGTTETGGAHDDGVVYRLKRKAGGFDYRVLHDFCFGCGDGAFPYASLIADVDGNLYGTTLGGGAHDCGIVFRLSPKGTLKVLHDFCTRAGDGDSPDQALSYFGKSTGALYDGVSPLYGTTSRGGAHGFGTAFMLTPHGGKWKETVLYTFCALANCADGAQPSGELLLDASGNLFGNAFLGGAHGNGVAYELSPTAARGSISERVLYSFCVDQLCTDGQGPSGALVMDAQSALIGTTEGGNGETGVIFKLTPDGADWQQSVLHTFCTPPTCADGYQPTGGLITDGAGNVYGTDELGGTGESGVGGGTAFRLQGGTLTSIYEFCSASGCADGRIPTGTLTMDGHGNLFGVTMQGGPQTAAGTVFELVHP